jgi:hypothetical protein
MAADDELFDEPEETTEAAPNRNRRILLIGVVALALICLVAILIYRILAGGGDEVGVGTPTPTPEQIGGPTVIATVEEKEPTVTPTRVISEQPETPAVEPTVVATVTAGTPAPPTPLASPVGGDEEGISFAGPGAARPTEVLKNGGFEEGFDEQGVGLNWQNFTNGAAIVSFSGESPGSHVKSGDSAQRISIDAASQPDRYAGIYQPVEVKSGRPYTLTLYGQVRTGQGDIQASSYGYRMQYAIDYNGGTNWQSLPAEDWVELPWDEQRLDASDVKFLSYTTTITPTTDRLTLFIRAWNKWAEPGLAEYTLDDLSLVGRAAAAPVKVENGETLIPVTGAGDSLDLLADSRFWGAMLILLLLGVGAIYRSRWGY